ncbi:YbaY family lipoprotein [Corallincola platygyrae]|uniref:YbaY family lipoprotein n=1 Tax=Corallincola platygyrae TaxID=1193278 RepID=A0ABW4XIS4_9GAMM
MRACWKYAIALVFISLFAVVGCDQSQQKAPTEGDVKSGVTAEAKMAKIVGEAFYRERIALAPGAELIVFLEDVSKADAPSEVLGEFSAVLENAPPYAFEISYDESKIDSRARYNLRAQIRLDEQLLFTTTQAYDPFAGSENKLMMQKVTPSQSSDSYSLIGSWELATVAGQSIDVVPDMAKPSLSFLTSGSVTGTGGCNRLNGSYEADSKQKGSLTFSPIATTSMMCAKGMEAEAALFKLFDQVKTYSASATELKLMGIGGIELATLTRVAE